MTTILDIAEIANDIYDTGSSRTRSNFTRNRSNGFQGALYEQGNYLVVAFKGTHNRHDLVSDFQLAVGRHPEQLEDARGLFEAGLGARGSRRLLLTGHSLGGALCQAVGYLTKTPFISFNAPPMATNMANPAWVSAARAGFAGLAGAAGGFLIGGLVYAAASKAGQLALGKVMPELALNIRLPYDPVSSSSWGGGHVGNVMTIPATPWTFNRHSMGNVIASLRGPANFVGGLTIDA